MKILILLFFISSFSYGQHQHHPKHNMIMMGEGEIFLSHIVYKVPHNYQVLLEIKLDAESRKAYISSKKAYPDQLHILLLDHMDISQIGTMETLSGAMLRESGEIRIEILKRVEVESFKLIYLDEVPLNLE